MPAKQTATIAAGAAGANCTVSANALFTVISDQPVDVEAYNATAGTYALLGQIDAKNKAAGFIAPTDTVRVRNQGQSAAKVEIW